MPRSYRAHASPLFAILFLATSCSHSAPSPVSPGGRATQATRATPVRTEQVSGTKALLIAVSPVNDNVVWLSGGQGTFVRTINGGTTWQAGRVPGADSLQFRDVHAVDANTAYVLSIGNGDQSRIYKTVDAGKTWILQFKNTDAKAFYDCMDFWDAKRGFVVGDAIDGDLAILTTSDGGARWTRVPPSTLPRATPNEGSFAASGTCALARHGGHGWMVASNPDFGRLFHSADYGRTWTVDTLPVTTRSGTGPESVSFLDSRNGVVFGGGTTSKAGDMFTAVTSDGGKTWSLKTSPPLLRGAWGGVYVPGARTPTMVAVSPSGAAWSGDNGTTWAVLDTNNYWSVGFASPRAGWAVGQSGRVTKLSNF